MGNRDLRDDRHDHADPAHAPLRALSRLNVGDRLRVGLRPNLHFCLPADPVQGVIMIGPGTGVAPFRAFMQEREAIGATGKNWLFFGNRRRADDSSTSASGRSSRSAACSAASIWHSPTISPRRFTCRTGCGMSGATSMPS
jgi:hypothetical protein